MGDIDINAVAADASAQLAKDFLAASFGKVIGTAKFAYEALFTDFAKHIASVHQRVTQVKIITSKDAPVDFNKIYVSANFKCGDKTYNDADLVSVAVAGRRCVISGNGGVGKTFAMRRIWLDIVRQQNKAPILIELRKLNSLSSYNLESFIRANSFGSESVGERAFEYFCRSGSFVFLLDGFDEVIKDKREELERQIIAFSSKFKACGLVVSGRPDDRFDSWQGFYTFHSCPLVFEQFRELIVKVPFDEGTKKSFLMVAKESFFGKHESFLSNPLLALMMLLTFRDNADIPRRVSSFYENCFTTLYAQHDALKESFSRTKSLDNLRFKRLFAAFSLVTYLDTKPSLDESELIKYIEKAKKISGVDVDNDTIKHELLESVNLLFKDGLNYTFIHRSFQEFFAAYCVAWVLSEKCERVLAVFAKRRYDRTLRLAYELHPKLVEKELIVPKYRSLKSSSSLPRRQSKVQGSIAAGRAGFSVEITLVKLVKSGEPVRYRPFSFRFNWAADYEILDVALSAAFDTEAGATNAHDAIAGLIISQVWPADDPFPEDLSIFDYEGGVDVLISFPDGVLTLRKMAEHDESEARIVAETLDALKDKFTKIAELIEATIVANNKRMTSLSEEVILRRSSDDEALEGLF